MTALLSGRAGLPIATLAVAVLVSLCSMTAAGMTVTADAPSHKTGDTVTITVSGADGSATLQLTWNGTTLLVYNVSVQNGTGSLRFKVPDYVVGRVTAFATTATSSASCVFDVVKNETQDGGDGGDGHDGVGGAWAPSAPLVAGATLATALCAMAAAWAVEASRWHLLGLSAAIAGARAATRESQESKWQILGAIRAQPGIHYSHLRRLLNLPNGVTAYWLRELESEGLIVSVRDGNKRRFYPKGVRVRHPAASLESLPKGLQNDILNLLEERPGMSQKEMCEALSTSQSLISYHLAALETGRYIEVVQGKVKRYIIAGGPVAYTCPKCHNQFTSDQAPRACPSCGWDLTAERAGKPSGGA